MAFDTDDLREFFGPDMPGTISPVVWSPSNGGLPREFDARLMRASPASLSMIGATEHAIQFITSDIPDAEQGDAVTFGGKCYTLRDRSFDHCSADGALSAYLIREAVE